MSGQREHGFMLLDSATAATLAQILPLLLLTLAVELRRTELHREFSRLKLITFFTVFAIMETLLVLSIDGALFPFQWFDGCSAVIIFAVMALLLRLSLSDPPPDETLP